MLSRLINQMSRVLRLGAVFYPKGKRCWDEVYFQTFELQYLWYLNLVHILAMGRLSSKGIILSPVLENPI